MKKQIKKWVLFIGLVILISVIIYLCCRSCGVTSVEGLRQIVESAGAWGLVLFLFLQIFVTTILCFIPATSMTFIICSVILFGALNGFLICVSGVLISSMLMFLIGRVGGEKVAIKLVGQESLQKAQDLIAVKSKIFLPLMFIFPAFPDDALCIVAGMTKMHWWEFLLITIFCRSVGVATTCFLGSSLIDWTSLSVIDWFVFISVCLIDIYFIFKVSNWIEKKLKNRKEGE